jgi:hypothetical protein
MTEKRCYIVKPSHVSPGSWEWVLNELIKPVVIERGYECVLAPPLGKRPHLIQQHIADLVQAELVVVDVTDWLKEHEDPTKDPDSDPTIFYLLGVRHTCSIGTILIAREDDDLATDVTSYHTIKYSSEGKDFGRFRRDLRRAIDRLAEDPREPDNAVQQYLHLQDKEEVQAKLDSLSKENEELKEKVERLAEALTGIAEPSSPSPRGQIKFKRVESAK